MVGIYKIHSPSGKVYIGQSWDIITRKSSYKKCRKKQAHLYNSINKYGWHMHSFYIIHELPEDVTQSVLDIYEQLYMDLYKSAGFELLNIREGGSRGKLSEDSKRKVSEGNRGKIRSEEFKQRVSEQMKGNKYCVGYKHSEEVRQKKIQGLKGRPVSEETRLKIANSLKDYYKSKVNGRH